MTTVGIQPNKSILTGEERHETVEYIICVVDDRGDRLLVNYSDPSSDTDATWLPVHRLADSAAVLVDTRWENGAIAALDDDEHYENYRWQVRAVHMRQDHVLLVADADFTVAISLSEIGNQAHLIAGCITRRLAMRFQADGDNRVVFVSLQHNCQLRMWRA